jgi:hypothetical protein
MSGKCVGVVSSYSKSFQRRFNFTNKIHDSVEKALRTADQVFGDYQLSCTLILVWFGFQTMNIGKP